MQRREVELDQKQVVKRSEVVHVARIWSLREEIREKPVPRWIVEGMEVVKRDCGLGKWGFSRVSHSWSQVVMKLVMNGVNGCEDHVEICS